MVVVIPFPKASAIHTHHMIHGLLKGPATRLVAHDGGRSYSTMAATSEVGRNGGSTVMATMAGCHGGSHAFWPTRSIHMAPKCN